MGQAGSPPLPDSLMFILHTKQVLTKISPFENAKLGLWADQGRASQGRDGRDMRGRRKSREKHSDGRRNKQGERTAKEKKK